MKRENINLSIKTKISLNQLNQDAVPKSPYTSVPSSRKSFITTMSTIKNDAYSRLLQNHHQLDKMVGNMNQKMQKVLQKHQGTFLMAYQNQMKRIRQELEDLRNKSRNKEISKQKIESLQKQLSIFREESNILFQKVQSKDKQLEILRLKYQESQSQKKHLQNEVKKLIKIIKSKQLSQITPAQKISKQYFQQQSDLISKTRCVTPLPSNKFNHSKTVNLGDSLFDKLKLIITREQQFTHAWKLIVENFLEKQKKYLQLKQKYQSLMKQNISNNRGQLQTFFLECIEITRRDMLRNSTLKNTINYRQQLIDFAQFRKQDKMKILESFIKNESIIKLIYNALFPKKIQIIK